MEAKGEHVIHTTARVREKGQDASQEQLAGKYQHGFKAGMHTLTMKHTYTYPASHPWLHSALYLDSRMAIDGITRDCYWAA